MSTQSVSHRRGGGVPDGGGLVPGAELIQALLAVRDGDFSVRLPRNRVGLEGKIADTFNEIVTANALVEESHGRRPRRGARDSPALNSG